MSIRIKDLDSIVQLADTDYVVIDQVDKSGKESLLNLKEYVNSDVYSETEVDSLLSDRALVSDTYTQAVLDGYLDAKADKITTYTKTEVDNLITGSSGISEAAVNILLDAKADKITTYTKTEVDGFLTDKANTSEVYSRTIIDALLESQQHDISDIPELDATIADKVVIDDDTMALASHETLSTSESIVAYVNDRVGSFTSNSIAILEEQQPNGHYVDGATGYVSGNTWRNSYDPNWYNGPAGTVSSMTFFQRNINTTIVNQGGIVESLSGKKFRLQDGTYMIRAYAFGYDTRTGMIRLKRHHTNQSYGTAYIAGFEQGYGDGWRSPLVFECTVVVGGNSDSRTFSFEQGTGESNYNQDLGSPYQPDSSVKEVYFRTEITKVG